MSVVSMGEFFTDDEYMTGRDICGLETTGKSELGGCRVIARCCGCCSLLAETVPQLKYADCLHVVNAGIFNELLREFSVWELDQRNTSNHSVVPFRGGGCCVARHNERRSGLFRLLSTSFVRGVVVDDFKSEIRRGGDSGQGPWMK